MSLESATYISQLSTANPTSGDPRNTADDHLRLIKSVLQNTFASLSGAVNASQADINLLTGAAVASVSQADIRLLAGIAATGRTLDNFPSGTKLPFYQTTPPVGWSVATAQNDSMMRVVSSGTTGGTSGAGAGHSPILNNVVPGHTHTYSGNTGNESATHTHQYDDYHSTGVYGVSVGSYGYGSIPTLTTRMSDAQSTNHTHAFSGNTDNGSSSTNWQPKYMDFCIGSKT